jgi:hypothetical protein
MVTAFCAMNVGLASHLRSVHASFGCFVFAEIPQRQPVPPTTYVPPVNVGYFQTPSVPNTFLIGPEPFGPQSKNHDQVPPVETASVALGERLVLGRDPRLRIQKRRDVKDAGDVMLTYSPSVCVSPGLRDPLLRLLVEERVLCSGATR